MRLRDNPRGKILRQLSIQWLLCACLLVGGVPSSLAASAQDQAVLDLAAALIQRVRYGALISVDDQGQPRSRVVDGFAPDEDFVIWVATRSTTRKVEQIRAHPQVTLYYWDPENRSYVSVMGQATIVDDLETKLRRRRAADNDRLYPLFPADYVLIKVTPDWLEGLLPGYRGNSDSWAPVSVDFKKRPPQVDQ
jgi:general stress protein 26